MSKIRNGGFELGNTKYWTAESSGTFETTGSLPKTGSYCGKFLGTNIGGNDIIHNDYIEVNPFDLLNLFGYAKSTDNGRVYLAAYAYDVDYSYIGELLGMSRTMDGTWLGINTQIPITEGVKYIRPGFHLYTNANVEYYLDGFTCDILDADKIMSGAVNMYFNYGTTANGDTSDDPKDMQMFKTFEADLIVFGASGTSPTLDISVYETNQDYEGQLVGTFTQATGATQERISLSHCTGRQMYIEYVLGGTNPSFNFRVDIAGKG